MELFAKMVKGWKLLIILTKSSTLGVSIVLEPFWQYFDSMLAYLKDFF